jgi:crossover junction endodeoxyribonuclease RusA
MQILLPWPPSNNVYYRHNRGRTHISDEGRAYQEAVIYLTRAQDIKRFGTLPIAVRLIANPPDNRRRDLDNLVKGVFDALTKARVWEDDSQVHDLHLKWGEVGKPGGLVVTVEALAGEA